MGKTLTIAMSYSDRTAKLLSSEIGLPPFQLVRQPGSIEEIFVRQANEAAYDIAEMSLASYCIAVGRGDRRLTAIPVFLSRSFRHNAIYVRADSPYEHPSQLRGRRFGFPEYQMTAAVWVRALFRHEWGVAPDNIEWFTFRPERIPIATPAKRAATNDIWQALIDGEVDAVMSARRPPREFFPDTGEGGVIRRIFRDVWQEEKDYYAKTGVFPIMHLVSLRAETVAAYPELPKMLYKTMLDVKNESVADMLETIKNSTSAPWLLESIEESARLMQGDVWPYGVAANREQIERFVTYLREDGLLEAELTLPQLFHESVLDT